MCGIDPALYVASKRLLDIAGAILLLIVFSPVLVLVALAIKLTDGGPVIFWQKRVGVWGQPFAFPKFRSMVPDAQRLKDGLAKDNHHGDSITFKMKKDPRVTRVGRLIRRLSIDEVPQLLCVLRGDMSLVGPRPALVGEVRIYSQRHRRRLDVRPGLTCIWQVSGRADLPFLEQMAMDVRYIEHRSLMLDMKLIWLTIPAVMSGRGAY